MITSFTFRSESIRKALFPPSSQAPKAMYELELTTNWFWLAWQCYGSTYITHNKSRSSLNNYLFDGWNISPPIGHSCWRQTKDKAFPVTPDASRWRREGCWAECTNYSTEYLRFSSKEVMLVEIHFGAMITYWVRRVRTRTMTGSIYMHLAWRLCIDHPSLYVANTSCGVDRRDVSGSMAYSSLAISMDKSREHFWSLAPALIGALLKHTYEISIHCAIMLLTWQLWYLSLRYFLCIFDIGRIPTMQPHHKYILGLICSLLLHWYHL